LLKVNSKAISAILR